jgi:hypothetical protein
VRLAAGDAYLTANKKTFVFIYSPTEKAGMHEVYCFKTNREPFVRRGSFLAHKSLG